MEYMCWQLQEEYSKCGLTIYIAKTKYMSLGTDINHLEMDNGDIITGCTECRYRASIFTKDGRNTKNIRHRVAQEKKNSRCIKWEMVSEGDNKKPKKKIYNSMVKSVLKYGAETWSLYEDDRRRINGTEMNALRRSARISKLDRKTNEYTGERMDAQDTVLDNVT